MAARDQSSELWRFRAVFDVARHGVALIDRHGRIDSWNGAAAELLGWDAGQALGHDLGWLHAHDEEPWPADALERAARGETVVHVGWRVAEDGGRFWCHATLHELRGPDGAPGGFAEAFGDVTAEKVATDALREAPALFDRALRHAPIGLATQDANLFYTWAPMGAAALGAGAVGEDDVLGRSDAELYPPEVAARLTALKREVLDGGSGLRTELPVERAGERRHFDLTLEPLRGADGRVAGVSTAAFDITDRKRAEEEVERSWTRLSEAEQLARMGSWEWDVRANRVTWSAGLFAIYGIDPEDFDPVYRPGDERVHPEDRARVDVLVARALETCEPIDLEYRIVRPDGRVRRLHGRAEVIADAEGRPLRLAGTVQDVTEMRATAEALDNTAAELGRHAAELHGLARRGPANGRDLSRTLTARQVEILGLVAQGLSNADIAERLYLTEGTVKWHVGKILRALGVANRAQAVARYLGSASAAPGGG
jgi:PAS domain S-box-containing protein